jgi:hypothetical protein
MIDGRALPVLLYPSPAALWGRFSSPPRPGKNEGGERLLASQKPPKQWLEKRLRDPLIGHSCDNRYGGERLCTAN